MNVVVIGTGFGARVVAPVFDATAGCRVVDVVHPRDAAAIDAALARPDVDLVSVHSPPFLHAEHVGRAVAGGRAVLCDKPFAMHASEAEAMLETARAAGAVHLCNFEFRHEPARVVVHDLVRDGAVGTVERVQWTHWSASSRHPLRPYGWLFDAAQGGGWIGAWASHAVDALRWWFGDVRVLHALRHLSVPTRPGPDGAPRRCTAEDGLTATLALPGGATALLDSTFAAAASLAPRVTISGSDGVIECVADTRVLLRRVDGARDEIPVDRGVQGDPHRVAMERWAVVVRDAVESRQVPDDAPTFADGAACDRVLDAMRDAPLRVAEGFATG
ncbi:MAG TPA: Gfo/Idh/MocA family oxidoreductase [Acidimicrobiia bacterium]|nr:Gfo/Idh/MocA family oxidoreductase [Acidimicrobiia bacterium]